MNDLIETAEDGVATLTLNRPESLNAVSHGMLEQLHAAFERLGADPAVGVIVVTGAGRAFCAGGDIKTMHERAAQGFEERAAGLRRMHRLPLLIRSIPKVVIGMVNGPAAGAGLGLAMSCDLRIAGRSARFGAAFVRMGLSGDFGASWLMTRLLGTAKAREMFLLGEMVDAEEAARLGLVTRVVDDEALAEETAALARRMADGPRVALGYMKANLHAAETEPFAPVLEMEAIHQARCSQTEDHKEAVRAFIEKRKPAFQGR